MYVHFYYNLLFLLFISFTACSSPEEQQLNQSLQLSGNNRQNLESVIQHYNSDSERQEAARFLIRNMIGKKTLDSVSVSENQPYYDALIKRYEQFGVYKKGIERAICDSIHMLYPNTKVIAVYSTDLKTLSAQYLIEHMNTAFDTWKKHPWSKNIDFETFCKYILPYTTENCYGKESDSFFKEKYKDIDKIMHDTDYTQVANIISQHIDSTFLSSWSLFAIHHPYLMPTSFSNIMKSNIGTCLEKNIYKIAALRSLGIPAVLNEIPCWGNSNSPHFWTEIITKESHLKLLDNEQHPYLNIRDTIISDTFWDYNYLSSFKGIPSYIYIQHKRYIPKVYRINYEIQKDNLSYLSTNTAPGFFKNPGLEDITDKYIKCKDITVDLWKNGSDDRYVYLCCFDPFREWVPVCYTKRNGRKAQFKKMGVNIFYLPAYYQNNAIVPAGDPFVLTKEGKLKIINNLPPKKENNIVIYSKYPYRSVLIYRASSMLGTRFQVANRADFADSLTVYKVNEIPYYEGNFDIKNKKAYRYLICNFKGTVFFNVGDIRVTDCENGMEKQLSGKLSGNPGIGGALLKNAMDGDRISYFENNIDVKDQYIAIDFGKPVHFNHVTYYPRSDDNRIVNGETYELFYWNRKWVSLGKQIGKDHRLVFNHVPENAVLRVHDCTKGNEERIFTYEHGKQIWW